MKQAAAKAKSGSEGISKQFKDSSKEKIGEMFGGGSILGMGAKGGAIAAGIAAVAFAGKELYEELVVKSKEYGRELEANERAVAKWADGARVKFDLVKESLAEFSAVAGTTEGIQANERALSRMKGQLDDISSTRKKQEDAEKSYDSKWGSTRNFELWMKGRLEDTAKSETAKKKELVGLEDELRKKYEEQARALAKLKNPLTNPEAKAALRDFIAEQKDAIKDLEGRTADEKSLDKLKERFGFKDADLAAARQAAAMKKTAENAKNASDFIKELERDIDDLANGITRGAEDAKLEELIKAGADEKQIARIKELIALKKEQNKEYKPLKALEAGTWDAITFQNKTKFEQEKKDKLKNEKQLNEVIQKLVMINLSIAGLNLASPVI